MGTDKAVQVLMHSSVSMKVSKVDIVEKIDSAKSELERALVDLHYLSEGESTASFSNHLLRKFLSLAETVAGNLQKQLEDYPVREVHFLVDALDHTTQMMSQMVGYNTVDSLDRSSLKWEEVDIADIARRIIRYYQRKLQPSQITFEFDAAVSTSRAWTDRILSAILFDNVFSTAIRRSPPESSVIIYVEEREDRIISYLQDQGGDLDADEVVALFESYEMPENGSVKSAGCGLALAKKAADKLRGAIWCETNQGNGCRFYISLPKPGRLN